MINIVMNNRRRIFLLCSIVFIFFLNFLFVAVASSDNFFSPLQTEASDISNSFVFKPPRPLYFAPLQLTRIVSGNPGESTRVSFLPVNVLDAERQFLQQGFISYFGALKIAQDTAKRVFILQTTAVYCSATLSMSGVNPITTTMALTPDIRTLTSQETNDLMGFKHSPPFGDTIKMFFYESEFQKTFDTVPAGTEIFISCPPQISFTALTTMVDPQAPLDTTIDFYNFATTPTPTPAPNPTDSQIYPIASTISTSYNFKYDFQSYPLSSLFSSPEVSFDDTQSTSIYPLNTITWTFNPPFLTHDMTYQGSMNLPPPVNVFQFFTGIFSTKHITQMLTMQYGLIGIPCRTNGVTVGYVQPGIVVQNTVQYGALQLVDSLKSYTTGKPDFSGFSHIFATEACTFQISLPRSLILDVPASNWDEVSGIYGVNGIPIISKLSLPQSYFMRLSLNQFYHIADTKFSDLGSTLPSPVPPNAPSIEVLGTTFLGTNLYDTLISPGPCAQRSASPSATAKVVDLTISGLLYSSEGKRLHFCFWNPTTFSPTPTLAPTKLLNSCFSDISLADKTYLSMIDSGPGSVPSYSCITPFLQAQAANYPIFRCLIQIPAGSRMSIHWMSSTTLFPVSKLGSTFTYTDSLLFRIVQVDGKYFTTTEGQFFDGNDRTADTINTLFSALPSPSEQLLFDTAISSQVTQPDKPILSNPWKYSYRVSFSSLQYYSAGARAVIRISVNDLQDMTSLYAFSDAKLETFTSTSVSLGVLKDPQIVQVGQVAFLIFNSVDHTTTVLTLTIPLIWNSTPLSNLPPLNNPFTFNQYRFNLYYDYLCFVTSFNAMTFPSNAPNVIFYLLRPNDGTGETYNMARTDVLPPSPLWYSQFYKTIATSQLDLQKFPALLFHHIQLHLSNQCAEYGLTQSPQNKTGVITAMDLCRKDIFLDMTLPSYGSAGDQRPLPTPTSLLTTTPHSVNSIQLSSSQTPGPQFASIAHHPAVVFFKLHLGIKESSPLNSFASFTNNWFEAIRTTFARVGTSTETIKEYQVFPDFSAAPSAFLHIAPEATSFMTPESELLSSIAGEAIFNKVFIPEPSIRDLDGSLRLLKSGEIVRFQVNWRQYICNAASVNVMALRSDGDNPINAFTLIGTFDGTKSLIIPLTVSKIRHSIGFPYSFTIPEFDMPLKFIAIVPRFGTNRPTSLRNLFIQNDLTIDWICLTDLIGIDPIPMQTQPTQPTWAQTSFISFSNPAYVVALSNPLNASPLIVDNPLRQLMYHKAMIAFAATSWHWYQELSSPYSLKYPQLTHTNFAYPFDGPAIDFRRFAISPLPVAETRLQGLSPSHTASQPYIIYQNPSPFLFSQNLLGYVFEDKYLPDTDESPWANMCPHLNFNSPSPYCIDPISVSTRPNTVTDPGYSLSQIDPSLFGSDSTINPAFLKISTKSPSLKPILPAPTTPVSVASTLVSSLPMIYLPSKPYQLFSLIVATDNDLSFPIYPRGLENLPPSPSSYPLIWYPFSQYGAKYPENDSQDPQDPQDSPASTIVLPFISSSSLSFEYFVAYKMIASDNLSFVKFDNSDISTFHDAISQASQCEESYTPYEFRINFYFNRQPASTCYSTPTESPTIDLSATTIQTKLHFSNPWVLSERNFLFYNEGSLTPLSFQLMNREIQFAMALSNIFAHVEIFDASFVEDTPDNSATLSFFHSVDSVVDLVTGENFLFGDSFSCDFWNNVPASFPSGFTLSKKFFGCKNSLPNADTQFLFGIMFHPATPRFNRYSIEVPQFQLLTERDNTEPDSTIFTLFPTPLATYPPASVLPQSVPEYLPPNFFEFTSALIINLSVETPAVLKELPADLFQPVKISAPKLSTHINLSVQLSFPWFEFEQSQTRLATSKVSLVFPPLLAISAQMIRQANPLSLIDFSSNQLDLLLWSKILFKTTPATNDLLNAELICFTDDSVPIKRTFSLSSTNTIDFTPPLPNESSKYKLMQLHIPSITTGVNTFIIGKDVPLQVQLYSMFFAPSDYIPLTRQLSVFWSYPPNWFTTFTSRTIYFRAKLTYKLSEIPEEIQPGENEVPLPQEQTTWITASYTIDNQYTTQTFPKTITNYFIPDFVTTAQFNIPPLPSWGGSLTITLIPVNLPSALPTLTFDTQISFEQAGFEISSVCTTGDGTFCSSCQEQNDYQPSGCTAILDGSSAAGRCTELVGKCPTYMTLDFSTCSCQCTTPTCRQNTRGAMLYFDQVDIDEMFIQYIEPRSKSYISRSLHSDFSVMLGLNKLPLPPPTTSASPKSQRGFLDQYIIGPATPHVPPVGYEELVLLPITYSTLNPAQILAYISIKPFSGTPQTTQFATALANRFKYLESRLQYILTYANTLSTPDDPILFHPLSVSTTESNNGKFIDLSSKFSSTTPNTPKLTTRCIQSSNTQPFTFSCPAPSTITSPFWSQCPSADPNAHRELSVQCVDLAGKVYDSKGESAPNWCSSDMLFPDFPKVTSLDLCSSSTPTYTSPILSDVSINIYPNLSFSITAGSSISFNWSYPYEGNLKANPTFTVDVFVSLASTPAPLTSFFIATDDEYDDFSFIDAPISMTTQQSFNSGYRVLLATFPATLRSARVNIPTDLVSVTQSGKFTLRVTQAPSALYPISQTYLINPLNLCADTLCDVDPNSQCTTASNGQCACKPNFVLDSITGLCTSKCEGRCLNDGVCDLASGLCKCPPSNRFLGLYCELDSSCERDNILLCHNHGFVPFINKACSTQCTCNNQYWQTDSSGAQCNKCTLVDFDIIPPSIPDGRLYCDPIGTNSTRTPRRGCDKCWCNHGYSGAQCTQRIMYGTIFFDPLVDAQTPGGFDILDTTISSTNLSLSEDTITVLINDLALSLNLPSTSVILSQALTLTSTTTTTNTPISPTSTATKNALTFELQPDLNVPMNDLYDMWSKIQTDPVSTPIGQTEASKEVGGIESVPDAYDPQCDATVAANKCPLGKDPLVDEDPVEPVVPPLVEPNNHTTSTAIIAIIIPVVIAGVILIAAIVAVFCMKKHKRGCFAPKNKQDNDHLELSGYSEKSTARFGDSTTNAQSRKQSSVVTQTAYSSGTSGAVDLIECEPDVDEEPLPAGWKKMKHTGTAEILYINEKEMKSLKYHPNQEPAGKGKFW